MNERESVRIQVAVVIPAYQAEGTIAEVVSAFAERASLVVVVDDASSDGTAKQVQSLQNPRVVLLRHTQNQGVGGAVKTGIRAALDRGAQVVVKADADGQMDPERLSELLVPLLEGRCDVSKGNRWYDRRALLNMPKARRFGNVALSFALRLASGHWKVFDPTNGYVAWRAELLRMIDLEAVPDRYLFESAMLIEAGFLRAKVLDVPIPARYRGEKSHLKISRQIFAFPPYLIRATLRRFWQLYFVTDFNALSLMLCAGVPLTLFALVFGGYHWYLSFVSGTPATAGTVLLAALPFLLGANCLLNALILDVGFTPAEPLFRPSPEDR